MVPSFPRKSFICMLLAAFQCHGLPFACYLQHFKATTFHYWQHLRAILPTKYLGVYIDTYVQPACTAYKLLICYPTVDKLPIACLYAIYIPFIAYLYTTSLLLTYGCYAASTHTIPRPQRGGGNNIHFADFEGRLARNAFWEIADARASQDGWRRSAAWRPLSLFLFPPQAQLYWLPILRPSIFNQTSAPVLSTPLF
jgi:hypothetical protein